MIILGIAYNFFLTQKENTVTNTSQFVISDIGLRKIIDALNKKFSLSKQKPKFKGLLTTGNIESEKIYAIKPLTFMNNSGICIRELIEYFKIDSKEVIVFHDDLDIEFGKVKAKFAGSSAGHNGIESIDKFIGKDYSRVRIGIGRPKTKADVSDHVLKDFDGSQL